MLEIADRLLALLTGGHRVAVATVISMTGSGPTALPWRTTPVQEPFALAQFEDLREDEQLARPSFEPLEAGLTFALDEVATDEAGLSAPIAYETLLIDPTRPPERPKPGYVLSAAVLARLAPFGAAGQAAIRKRGRATTLVA